MRHERQHEPRPKDGRQTAPLFDICFPPALPSTLSVCLSIVSIHLSLSLRYVFRKCSREILGETVHAALAASLVVVAQCRAAEPLRTREALTHAQSYISFYLH